MDSDFLLEKNGKNFLVEAKVWPAWFGEKARERDNELSYEVAKRYFCNYPWLLSDNCSIHDQTVPVHGKMIIWWKRVSKDHDKIIRDFTLCLGHEFDLRYMDEILTKLLETKPTWYIEIIKEVKDHILEFLNQLENSVVHL